MLQCAMYLFHKKHCRELEAIRSIITDIVPIVVLRVETQQGWLNP